MITLGVDDLQDPDGHLWEVVWNPQLDVAD
jgi:predicted lactoylglutathione lyase